MRLDEFLEKNHLLKNEFRGAGRWRDKILAAPRISGRDILT